MRGGRVSLGAVPDRLRQSARVCLDQVIDPAGYPSYSQAASFSAAVTPDFSAPGEKPASCRTSFWTF
jgi:hypothetical protein